MLFLQLLQQQGHQRQPCDPAEKLELPHLEKIFLPQSQGFLTLSFVPSEPLRGYLRPAAETYWDTLQGLLSRVEGSPPCFRVHFSAA